VCGARRRFLRTAAGGLVVGLTGCATPSPPISSTISVPALAPRPGDTWNYMSTSGWSQIPPQAFTCQVLDVNPFGIRDRMTAVGFGDARVDVFPGKLELLPRSLGSGFAVHEFTPYLQAFEQLAPGQTWFGIPMPLGAATMAPWYAQARVQGAESITVTAGTFDAIRVELTASRAGYGVAPSADTAQMQGAAWFSPAVKRVVRMDYNTWTQTMLPIDRQSYQLVSFSPA
jgi:hypothetical protein